MKQNQADTLKFGFFFLSNESAASALYFAGFQRGLSFQNSNQIVIAEVIDSARTSRRVAYAIEPEFGAALEAKDLEHLCRVAVSQFLAKVSPEGASPSTLPLDLSEPPWEGSVQPVKLTALV